MHKLEAAVTDEERVFVRMLDAEVVLPPLSPDFEQKVLAQLHAVRQPVWETDPEPPMTDAEQALLQTLGDDPVLPPLSPDFEQKVLAQLHAVRQPVWEIDPEPPMTDAEQALLQTLGDDPALPPLSPDFKQRVMEQLEARSQPQETIQKRLGALFAVDKEVSIRISREKELDAAISRLKIEADTYLEERRIDARINELTREIAAILGKPASAITLCLEAQQIVVAIAGEEPRHTALKLWTLFDTPVRKRGGVWMVSGYQTPYASRDLNHLTRPQPVQRYGALQSGMESGERLAGKMQVSRVPALV